ncbi:hypothetical protein LJC19_07295 [Oxalobacter sp. OttesenSCG-928-P03]|nr:hypothetical protein [Oxalobacter sp. OttesenSCG-928-P03]
MNGAITYNSSQSFSVTDDSGLNSTGGTTAVSRLQSVSVIDLSTFGGAQDAIWIADAAINAVVREQTRYGALQSRLGYTIEFLEISSENLSAARSRIEDADYAAETAALARASILQQAALAMLAYANDMQSNLIMTLLESIRRN